MSVNPTGQKIKLKSLSTTNMTGRAFALALFLVSSVAIQPVQSQSSSCPIDASKINLNGIALACDANRPDLCESCICFLANRINDAGYDVRSPDFNIDACALENLGVLMDAGATMSAFIKVSNCPRDADMFDCVKSPPPANIQTSPPSPPFWLRNGNGNSSVLQTFESLDANVTSGKSSEKVSKGIVATISSLAGLIFLACVFMFVAMRCRARHRIELETAYVETMHDGYKSPFTLSLKGVTCALPNGRVIVQRFSTSFVSGNLVGILGPSGCGKTTLMNAMHYGELLTAGFVQINDEDIDVKRHRVASVPQDPYAELVGNLTVKETISLSARLRLPWFLSKSTIDRATTETMEALGLSAVAQSKVGEPTKHTLSGGEARRVSIATELVVDPHVILLDEPTSGLDAHTSSRVITTLRDLSRKGPLVICTIHQPSTRSLQLFDTMIVLGQTGEVVWIGSLDDLDQALIDINMRPPAGSSTAEWILEIACDATMRSSFITAVAALEDKSEKTPLRLKSQERLSFDVPKSLLTTMHVLLWRALIVLVRDMWGIYAHFCVPVGISLILGGLYFNVDKTLEGFQNRMGATFFLLVYFALSAMSLIDLFNSERSVAQRQLRSRYYSHLEYVVSKTTMDWILLRIPSSLVSSLIFYFMMDLRQSFGAVLIFIGYIVLFVVVQSNICATMTYISKNTATATLGTTCILLITAIFSGFLINVKTLPAGAAWVKFVSPFYYVWSGILANEMQGGPYLFNANFDGDLVVVPVSGQTYLDAIGVHFNQVPRNFYCMIALAVCTYVTACVSFRCVACR